MAKFIEHTGMHRKTRRFNGKAYHADRVTHSKMEAGMLAKAFRVKGIKVRVVPTKTFGYVIYTRW